MQPYILNVPAYTPKQLIEGYSSCIWTDRYLPAGEFQIVTSQPAHEKLLIPGTLICEGSSTEVMMVETVEKAINPNGYIETIITGRSVDAIFDERIIWGPHGTALLTPKSYSNLDMALVLMWNSVVNTSVEDALHTQLRPAALYTDSPIPNVVITDSTPTATLTAYKFSLQMGAAGNSIREFLANDGYGMRTIRPPSKTTAKLVSVNTVNGSTRGTITKTPTSSFSGLRLDVFKGTDRTQGQSAVPRVVLVAAAGHLMNVKILDSDKDFATTLITTTSASKTYGSSTPYSKPDPGFSIKVRYLDGSKLVEGLTDPEADLIVPIFAGQYWVAHSGRALLDGDVQEGVPYRYGVDYFVGDLVTLQYNNIVQNMYVSEYTRVEDAEGERSYPTLATSPSGTTRGIQRL